MSTHFQTIAGTQPVRIERDRRTFTRVPYPRQATVWTETRGKFRVSLEDVSRIGLGLRTDSPLDVGEPLWIAFGDIVLREEPVALDGIALWGHEARDGFRIGVRIAHRNTHSLELASEVFYDAVRRHAPRFPASRETPAQSAGPLVDGVNMRPRGDRVL